MAQVKCPPTGGRYKAFILCAPNYIYQPTCSTNGAVKNSFDTVEAAQCGAEDFIRKSLPNQSPDVYILDTQDHKIVSHAVSPKKPMLDWK